MYSMITDRHNHDDGYIALVNITLDNLPDKIHINGMNLHKKDEFHISLVATKHLAPLIDASDIEGASKILERHFVEFADQNDLTKFTLTGEYRLVTKDERVTLVAMVDMDNVPALFDFLRIRNKVDLPLQPTHITLYSLQPNTGIGILSEDEMNTISKRMELPELSQLKVVQNL